MENKTKQNVEITDTKDDGLETRKIRSRLSRYSLLFKWNKESKEPITSFCPFCWKYYSNCNTCVVSPTVCADSSYMGFIWDLREKYDDKTKVDNLEKEDLNKMISLLNESIIEDDDNDEYELVMNIDNGHYTEVQR